MPLNQARIDIQTFLKTNWTQTDIVFKNDKPKMARLLDGTDPFICFDLSWGAEKQLSHPSPLAKFARAGVLAANIYVRLEDGEGLIYSTADSFFDLVREERMNNIKIQSPKIGTKDETTSWQVLFTVTGLGVYYNKAIV